MRKNAQRSLFVAFSGGESLAQTGELINAEGFQHNGGSLVGVFGLRLFYDQIDSFGTFSERN
jgi:hypothetical protein